MKTYVINMEKDTIKKENILSQLRTIPQLDFEIIKACEGKKLSEEELRDLGYYKFQERYREFGTLPAFGCSVSHFRIYEKIAKEDPVALVLEDDVIIANNFIDKLNSIRDFIASMNDEPTIILLSPHFYYNKKDVFPTENNDVKITKVQGGYMASGYIINKAGAQLLEKRLYPIQYIADDWKEFIKMGLKLYGVLPHFTSFSDGLGEIGKSQLQKKESFINKIKHCLGRTKGKLKFQFHYLNGLRFSKKIW